MQDTVDQAAAPPRTLVQIIRMHAARCAETAWLTPSVCAFSGTGLVAGGLIA